MTIIEMWKAAGKVFRVGGQNEEFSFGHVKFDMLIRHEEMTGGN